MVQFLKPDGFDTAEEFNALANAVGRWRKYHHPRHVEGWDIAAFCRRIKAAGLDSPPTNHYCPVCECVVEPFDADTIIAGGDWMHDACLLELVASPAVDEAAAKVRAQARWDAGQWRAA